MFEKIKAWFNKKDPVVDESSYRGKKVNPALKKEDIPNPYGDPKSKLDFSKSILNEKDIEIHL